MIRKIEILSDKHCVIYKSMLNQQPRDESPETTEEFMIRVERMIGENEVIGSVPEQNPIPIISAGVTGDAFVGAPAWATHRAADEDGKEFWFDGLPILRKAYPHEWDCIGACMECKDKVIIYSHWKSSVVVRNQS